MSVRGWPELNSNADRLIGFVALARQYPDARLVFTGGAAVLRGDRAVSEADVADAVFAKLGLDPGRVNVNGGAIALGHPLGCTGAKLTATILQEMKRRNARYGMVTMCVGGGMGAAGIFERM